MDTCLFWILWSHPNQMVVSALQCTENQPTLTCICSKTATIPFQQNTVCVNTLHHRARAVCSNHQLLKEEDHLQRVLLENKHHIWALNRMKMKINASSNQDQNKRGTNISANATSGNQRPYMVVPYVKGLSKSLKMDAENMVYMYFVKEVIPSKAS